MPKFVDALLLGSRVRRHQRPDLLDDRLRADMGLSGEPMRRVHPFLLGSLIAR